MRTSNGNLEYQNAGRNADNDMDSGGNWTEGHSGCLVAKKKKIYILYISWIIGEHLLVMGSQRDTHLKMVD